MTLTRWNPVSDLAAVEIDRLNRMFDAAFSGELAGGAWVPAADIYETEAQDVVVKIELPEMKREDIKVTVENSVLTIEGERKFDATTKRDQYQPHRARLRCLSAAASRSRPRWTPRA